MQLSKNFTLTEFCHSNTGESAGIKNILPNEYLSNAKQICELAEIARSLLNRSININSGYRSKELNDYLRYVGYSSSNTSSHCFGCAIDIATSKNYEDTKKEQDIIKDYFLKNKENIEFDQLILYGFCNKKPKRFIHIGIAKPNQKNRKLIGFYKNNTYVWI